MRHLISLTILAGLTSGGRAIGEGRDLPFAPSFCQAEVKKTLDGWRAQGEWEEQAPDDDVKAQFTSPTSEIGTWVQMSKMKNDAIEAQRLTRHSRVVVVWQKENCEPKANLKTIDEKANYKDEQFTDDKLRTLVANPSNKGALLLWSPHMDYSISAIANIKKAAQAAGVKLDLILDSRSDEKEAIKAAKKLKIAIVRNDSLELHMRGAELHFPTLLVYSRGKISPILPGLCGVALYEDYIRKNL